MTRLVPDRLPRLLWAALLMVGACGGIAEQGETNDGDPPEAQAGEMPFEEPTGPFTLGVMDVRWTDSARGEPFTKDPEDRRSVAARIWYPAATAENGSVPYLADPDEYRGDPDLEDVTDLRAPGKQDAPPSSEGPFPVLLYNHGGGMTRFSSTFTTGELASHGYVVISVGHNGFNRSRWLSDGKSIAPDTLTFPQPTGNLLEDAYASWEFLGEAHFPQWVADARHALDQVLEMNKEGPLAGIMDPARVGAYGWSFGGATAIELAAVDPRVRAAVDHDGQLFGEAPTSGTDRPFMLFHGGIPEPPPGETPEQEAANRAAFDELIGVVASTDAALKAASSGPWYDVTVEGANHGSFSDLTLWVPGASPDIDAARAHHIINALTVAFFDRHLKERPAPLLDEGAGTFPEIRLTRGSP